MRHHNQNRKLGRERKQRKALLNSLARSLVLHSKITTTEAKAKEIRPFVEKLITVGKKAGIASRRVLTAKVGPGATKLIMDSLVQKYEGRSGGYARITKLPARKSDGSKMAIIELVN